MTLWRHFGDPLGFLSPKPSPDTPKTIRFSAQITTLYTYPENWRAFKALIAAQYSGARLRVASAPPQFSFGHTNRSPQFLKKFPLGKVPAFEGDDGFCVFESNAIAYYVSTEELRGSTPEAAAAVLQWVNFADSDVVPPASTWEKDSGKKDKDKDKEKEKDKEPPRKEKPRKEEKRPEPDEDLDECEQVLAAEPKAKDPFAHLPKSPFVLDEFKRKYSNEDTLTVALPHFWEHFDREGWSLWYCQYRYPEELSQTFMSCNLITGGLCPDWQVDYESYSWRRLDPDSAECRTLVTEYFLWEGDFSHVGKPFNQGKIFK
uniref:Eukaryotic translation elongation factor 1 gamma n=1 Tax=Zosterops lateralis melanops TaxID=1220523 RepID=A0A8D2P1R4_ZOSLA